MLMLSHSVAVVESAFPLTFFFLENAFVSEFFICKTTKSQENCWKHDRNFTDVK